MNARSPSRAFTLLELLAVITIIAVLTAIVIGVGRHAAQAGKIARAKAELAALSVALEAYKRQYGDYPRVASDTSLDAYNSGQFLYQALSGLRGPLGQVLGTQQRILFERSRFTMADPNLPDDRPDNHFVDPWGQVYRYAYKASSDWKNSAYLLVSSGSDENLVLPFPADGLIDAEYTDAPVNVDNLYANQNG